MATPTTPGMTVDQMQRFVDRLKGIKPNDKNQYIYAGKTYTKTAWNNFVSGYEKRLTELKRADEVSAEGGAYVFSAAGQAQLQKDAEIIRIDKLGQSVWTLVQTLKRESDKSVSVTEQNNLQQWIRFYEGEMKRLETYANSLSGGGAIRNIPGVKLVSVAEAKKPFAAPSAAATPAPAQTPAPAPAPAAAQPTTNVDISNITNASQARTEIARLRERSNALKALVGEKQSNGAVLYYEVVGGQGMSKMQRDTIVANIEARIAALNTKFFAETPAATAATPSPTTPAPAAAVTGSTGPLTAGQRGEAGISPSAGTPTIDLSGVNFETVAPGGVPAAGPSVVAPTPSAGIPTVTPAPAAGTPAAGTPVSAPAPAPAAGPAFVDPQTGATVQPGQQIGGPDRALPNGGAVVNGVYIPPGIDYTWLGQQIPQDWESAAKELYGAYYEMVKQYPELGTLLKNAIQQGWSDDKFQYELEQTNWWKTTSSNARSWETLQIQDPASAQVQLDNRIALLTDTAQRLGITLSAESLAKIAEDSIKLGLELTSQLENIVGAEALRSSGTVTQLRFGFVGQSIRETARKYGVSLSDVTFNEWVNKIAVGAESVETFDAYANQIARTLYPTLQSGFDRGLTFGQMTDPYAQVASRILDIPSTQVDFTDPKWATAFTMKNEKGEQVPMTYGEWSDYLRTNPAFGYEYTDEAVNKAYTVVNQLAELFGRA